MKESERDELRKRVDEARRDEVDKDRRQSEELRARSTGEIKRDAAGRKAIFAAQLAHDPGSNQLAVVARRDQEVYLISVGSGHGCILDLRGDAPTLTLPTGIYALTADSADWLPFEGDAERILAIVAPMLDAAS